MAQFIFNQWLEDFLNLREFAFEWDEGNRTKSTLKHGVPNSDSEEVFFDQNNVPVGIQISPICNEDRFGILGKNFGGLPFFVSFTIRNSKIRIISSRSMSLRERIHYEKRNLLR